MNLSEETLIGKEGEGWSIQRDVRKKTKTKVSVCSKAVPKKRRNKVSKVIKLDVVYH
jgi:hypothetical protein